MAELPATMTAITVPTPGGPEALVPTERPVPQPGRGEVLVKVAAAGINRPDVMQRRGLYPPPPGASDIPGLEIAGTVVAVGEGAVRYKVGDAVCALVTGGGYAQYCPAPEATTLPVPAGLSMAEAAAIPETFFTVWSNVFDRARLQSGETLLGSWRGGGHRHHGHHARQGVRRAGLHHRRLAGKVRGPAATSGLTLPSTTRRRISWPR